MKAMVEVSPFRAQDVQEIRERAELRYEIAAGTWKDVETQGASYTVRLDGEAIMCGGVAQAETGEVEAWAMVDERRLRHVFTIHRIARLVINDAVRRFGRIQAHVVCEGMPKAHEWVQRLGFKLEVPRIENFGPDGRAFARYARDI